LEPQLRGFIGLLTSDWESQGVLMPDDDEA